MLGRALRHVNNVILLEANGARRNAPDVLLTISDGTSQDDIIIPSRELRDHHVLVSNTVNWPINPNNGSQVDVILTLSLLFSLIKNKSKCTA